MSDLGLIEIIQKSLIINEAKVGGRKLTKSLYKQIPEEEYYPTCRDGVRMVAWLNYHWEDCQESEWTDVSSHIHYHVLLGEGDKPLRGTVFKPLQLTRAIELGFEGQKALRALIARKMLKGADIQAKRHYGGDYRVTMSHQFKGEQIEVYDEFTSYLETHPARLSYMDKSWFKNNPSEPPVQLVKVSQPATEHEALIVAIEENIQQTQEWRQELSQIWHLVEEETPQVFI